jgi:hypothetical protein
MEASRDAFYCGSDLLSLFIQYSAKVIEFGQEPFVTLIASVGAAGGSRGSSLGDGTGVDVGFSVFFDGLFFGPVGSIDASWGSLDYGSELLTLLVEFGAKAFEFSYEIFVTLVAGVGAAVAS